MVGNLVGFAMPGVPNPELQGDWEVSRASDVVRPTGSTFAEAVLGESVAAERLHPQVRRESCCPAIGG